MGRRERQRFRARFRRPEGVKVTLQDWRVTVAHGVWPYIATDTIVVQALYKAHAIRVAQRLLKDYDPQHRIIGYYARGA